MSAVSILSPDWSKWIASNLEQGCSEASLVEIMVNKRFDRAVAASAVKEVAVRRPSVAQQEAYRYEESRIGLGNEYRLNDRTVKVRTRLTRPDIVVVDDFLSKDECEEIIRQSKGKLSRNTVVDPETGRFNVIGDRTSSGTYLQRDENEFVARLDRRIAELMNWPLECGEGIQVLNYKPGAEYKAHFDYFPPEQVQRDPTFSRSGQRVATLVMYLNDVEQGGETCFPEIGLSVLPKQGSAAYFAYANSLGQVDPLTLHAGAPVIAGEKWIATKWMRQRPY